MILESITLENFRSAENEHIRFDPGVNLLYGNNAEGKTNVLEAIYFFARGRSFRTARESDLVRFGADGSQRRYRSRADGGSLRKELLAGVSDIRISERKKHAL